ncbi:protein LNK2-like isoform X1 [Triticum urartu]|nr:protein LNK2-like isoform X1 [Triticum urartu]
MFDCNGESQQQVGDGIWAELRENEDHITPCPKDTKDSRSICVRDQKKNDDEAASVVGLTECTSGGQTEHPGLEKQAATEASGHYSAAQHDIESLPDLPLLSTTFDRNYNDDNIASTYLDFNSASSLQKVTRSVSVQLDGEPEVFGNEHEEKSNNFLDCDWGNIGDFDDFDYLFSNTEALFGNEMIFNGSDFLVTSSDVVDGTVQSIPFPRVPLNKQPSSDCGSSSVLINCIPSKIAKQEIKGDVEKRPMKSQRKPDEGSKSKTSNNTSGFSQKQGHQQPDSLHSLSEPPVQHFQTRQYALLHDSKNMELFQDAIQLVFPGYGYPAYLCPTIPAVSNIQAEGHQTNPKAACYQTSVDPLKQSSSTEKPQDMPSRALMMTPQEKIEKLRLRQQQHALRAIQQQQQQFRQEGSGRDTLVPRAYSRRKKNSDSLGSSGIIDENAPEQTSACRKEIHKNSGIPDDPFIEEKIYYELKDALGKLDARTRLCIRDSLLRLAHSSSQRQIAGDRTSSNKTKRDEDEVSENDASNRRKRSLVKEAETDTNPVDRIVAHLLFHRPCSTVATLAKEEIASSTLMSLEADSKMPGAMPGRPSGDQQTAQEMAIQPSV